MKGKLFCNHGERATSHVQRVLTSAFPVEVAHAAGYGRYPWMHVSYHRDSIDKGDHSITG